ncbi:AntA/AntB antirepressor [Andreesenia angusta]|uniref:AntA/AntB antirepressor n=1 Tax=Andreesenia angusta TaxID=39480 RepID=A0A1S1V947_9FIRM|nr:antA/AntB antirepressor family protein [Andreesenia angusta]OHW63122.1 AntA/AntB antirepressor [Andreesenia angusta]
MNELIKVEMNDNQEQIVSGRELHEFLEVGTQYTKWFERMTEYGFAENVDFAVIVKNDYDETAFGGKRKITDHVIKLDMAKELSMIQRTDKGKQARLYFIEVEKAWNTPEAVYARALKMADRKLLDYKQEVKQLQDTIAYKNEVIKGAVMDVDVLTKRNVLNRVVRYRGANFSERWRELYKSYKETYHMDLKARTEGYNIRQSKKKDHLTTIAYAEKFGHIDDLYKVALKLYETDVNDILEHLKEIA